MSLSKYIRPRPPLPLERLIFQSNQCHATQLKPRPPKRYQLRRARQAQAYSFDPQVDTTWFASRIIATVRTWMPGSSDPAPGVSLGIHIAGAYSAIKDIFKRAYEYICDFLDKTLSNIKRFAAAAGVLMHSLFDYLRTVPHMISKMINFFKNLVGVDTDAEKIIEHLAPSEVIKTHTSGYHPIGEDDEEPHLQDPFNTDFDFDPQSASWISGAFTTLLTLGSTIMYGVSSCSSTISDPAYYLAKVNTLTAFALNLERIDPLKSSKRIISLVYKAFTGKHAFEEFQCASDFTLRYESIMTLMHETDSLVNPPATTIKQIREEFVVLRKCYDNCLILCPAEMQKMKTQFQHIEDRCRNFYAASYGSDRRIKPVSIIMRGPPGCGKSQTQEHIIKQIMNVVIAASEIKETDSDYSVIQEHATRPSSLTRNCIGDAPKFDDGYCYQLFMILEEFQTSKSEELKFQWFNKLMRYIDDAPCPLDMAFKDKGSVYFNSPFVVATGNFSSLSLPVEHPSAVHRRIDFDIITSPASRNGEMFDVTKHVVYKFSTECLKAYRDDNSPPNQTVKRILKTHPEIANGFTYNQLICMIAGVYIERITGKSVPPTAPINFTALSATGLLESISQPRQAAYFNHSLSNTVQNPTNATDVTYRNKGIITPPPLTPVIDDQAQAVFDQYDKPSAKPATASQPRRPKPPAKSTTTTQHKPRQNRGVIPPKVVNTSLQELTNDTDDDELFAQCGEGSECYQKQLNPLQLFRLLTSINLKYACSRTSEILAQLMQIETVLNHHYSPGYVKVLQIENPYADYAKFVQDMHNIRTKFVVPKQRKAADSKRMGTIRWIYSFVTPLLSYCRSVPTYTSRQETTNNMPLRKAYCKMSNTQRTIIRTDRPELKLPESARIAEIQYDQRVRQLRNAPSRAKRNATRQKMHIAKKQEMRRQLASVDRNDYPRDKIDREVYDDDGYYIEDPYDDLDDNDFKDAREVFDRVFAEDKEIDVDSRIARIETETRYRSTGFDWADDDDSFDPQIRTTTDVAKDSVFAPDNTFTENIGFQFSKFYSKIAYSLHRDMERFCDADERNEMFQRMNDHYYHRHDLFKKIPIRKFMATTALEHYGFLLDDLERIIDEGQDVHMYMCLVKTGGWTPHCRRLLGMSVIIAKKLYQKNDPRFVNVSYDDVQYILHAAQIYNNQKFTEDEILEIKAIHRAAIDRKVRNIAPVQSRIGWISNVCSIISSIMSIFLTGMVIYGLVSLGLYIHKMITGEEDDDDYLVAQSMSDFEVMNPDTKEKFLMMLQSKDNYRAPHKGARKPKNFAARYSFTPQSASQDTQLRKIFANQYSVCLPNGHRLAGCTFVASNICLMNRHVFYASPEFLLVPYVPSQAHQVTTVLRDHVTLLTDCVDRDYVLFTVMGVQPHADIRKKFITQARYGSSTNFGVASILRIDQSGDGLPTPTVEPIRCHGIDSTNRNINTLGIKTTGKFVYTFLNAAPGECGNPVVCYGNGDDFTIVGMHVAARDKNSVGTPIFLEDLYYEEDDTLPVEPQADISLCLDDPIVGAYTYNTETFEFETPVLTNPTNKTTLAATPFTLCDPPLFGEVPVAPCELNNANYNTSRKKEDSMECCRNPAPQAITVMQEYHVPIVETLISIRGSTTYLAGCRTLTPKESLYGAKEFDLAPFDCKTADGIRLKILGIKKIFLQYLMWCTFCIAACPDDTCPTCGRKSIPNPHVARFLDVIQKYLKLFASGIFTYQVCFDSLKDELRDIARVMAGAVRVFNVTDFVDNVLLKMAVGHFFYKYSQVGPLNGAACGINPASNMWGYYFNQFVGDESVVFLDVKGFDYVATLWLRIIVYYMLTVSYQSAGPFAVAFAKWAYVSCMCAIRFNRRIGRLLNRGNSSGNFGTTVFNTINNHIFHLVVLIIVSLKRGLDPIITLKTFNVLLYSDDNVSSLKNCLWWNTKFVSTAFKDVWHITMTDVNKNTLEDIGDDLYTIMDAEFLSRRFVPGGGIVYCPLSFESLVQSLYYVRVPHKDRTPETILIQLQENLKNFSRELIEWNHDPKQAFLMWARVYNYIQVNNIPVYLPPMEEASVKYAMW